MTICARENVQLKKRQILFSVVSRCLNEPGIDNGMTILYTQCSFEPILTSPAGVVAKYCDEYVCVSVCPRGYDRNHTRHLYQIFVHVAYGRGSVLPRRRCDTSCISGFMDDITFFFL